MDNAGASCLYPSSSKRNRPDAQGRCFSGQFSIYAGFYGRRCISCEGGPNRSVPSRDRDTDLEAGTACTLFQARFFPHEKKNPKFFLF